MTIPTAKQAYTIATGTGKIAAYVFSDHDPGESNINYELYTGWINTQTKAIWYLEGLNYSSGSAAAQWRSVGPVVVSASSPTAADYLYPEGQLWINNTAGSAWILVNLTGTTATWEEVSSGVASGILTITGDVGGSISPDGSRNLNLRGTPGQINVVGNPATNTLTLSLAGGSQAVDSFQVDATTAPGTNPVLPDATGKVTISGAQVASGTTADVIQTNSIAANAYEIQVQRAASSAASNRDLNGVCHFDDGDFTVDSNGYVAILNSALHRFVGVDASTPPGTDPVGPDAAGTITVTGGQAAAGSVANCIRTNSLAANTYTIEVQRSSHAAAANAALNGVAHFDSTYFSVDANGFVTTAGPSTPTTIGVDASTPPGSDPVTRDGSGVIHFTGAQVAAGTTANVIQTNSTVANTATIEIQRSAAAASSTVGSNGVCHFDSANFSVDANGFVEIIGSGLAWEEITATGPTSLEVNKGYILNNAGLVTVALPATAALGSVIKITGKGAGGWTLTQNAGQTIYFASANTTTGAGGSLASTGARDSIELVCVTANNDFNVISSTGNITIV